MYNENHSLNLLSKSHNETTNCTLIFAILRWQSLNFLRFLRLKVVLLLNDNGQITDLSFKNVTNEWHVSSLKNKEFPFLRATFGVFQGFAETFWCSAEFWIEFSQCCIDNSASNSHFWANWRTELRNEMMNAGWIYLKLKNCSLYFAQLHSSTYPASSECVGLK